MLGMTIQMKNNRIPLAYLNYCRFHHVCTYKLAWLRFGVLTLCIQIKLGWFLPKKRPDLKKIFKFEDWACFYKIEWFKNWIDQKMFCTPIVYSIFEFRIQNWYSKTKVMLLCTFGKSDSREVIWKWPPKLA